MYMTQNSQFQYKNVCTLRCRFIRDIDINNSGRLYNGRDHREDRSHRRIQNYTYSDSVCASADEAEGKEDGSVKVQVFLRVEVCSVYTKVSLYCKLTTPK
jgi:hypothetical protein